MEEILIGLCLVAVACLVVQFLGRRPDGQFVPPPDTSQASVPPVSMFDRIGALFQASQGRPLASAQSLWEGNASEVSRRLSAQGGVTTSMEQAFLLQQPY